MNKFDSAEWPSSDGDDVNEIDSGGAGTGPDGPDTPPVDPGHFLLPDLAKSVTRQVRISGPTEWTLLLVGLDSLDLGLHVSWDGRWEKIVEQLAEQKQLAAGTKGRELPPELGRGLMLPGGKPPMYAFHLLLTGIQVWISRALQATGTPNVYVSLPSDRLRHENILPQMEELQDWILLLGGTLTLVGVSRCDIAADFLLREPLTSDFIKSHLMTRSKKRREHSIEDQLETFYVGQGKSPIQLRIYDKSAEIVAGNGLKDWFYPLWRIEPGTPQVWRIEVQLRRLALRQFGVKTLEQLPDLAPKIWNTITERWASLRMPNDSNATRRTVQPFWAAVQAAGEDLGSAILAHRDTSKGSKAPARWYIAQGSGCLAGFAARINAENFDSALQQFADAIRHYWQEKDFGKAYRIKRMLLNLPIDPSSGEGVPG